MLIERVGGGLELAGAEWQLCLPSLLGYSSIGAQALEDTDHVGGRKHAPPTLLRYRHSL